MLSRNGKKDPMYQKLKHELRFLFFFIAIFVVKLTLQDSIDSIIFRSNLKKIKFGRKKVYKLNMSC